MVRDDNKTNQVVFSEPPSNSVKLSVKLNCTNIRPRDRGDLTGSRAGRVSPRHLHVTAVNKWNVAPGE